MEPSISTASLVLLVVVLGRYMGRTLISSSSVLCKRCVNGYPEIITTSCSGKAPNVLLSRTDSGSLDPSTPESKELPSSSNRRIHLYIRAGNIYSISLERFLWRPSFNTRLLYNWRASFKHTVFLTNIHRNTGNACLQYHNRSRHTYPTPKPQC
jgi:hypothetical protein